ncbi:potassium channel family protein [Fulvivirga ligni]|uniref:potassium channel family protein n=1 Tax=Fulvivirga ligni TaxID=2904246 RepID=UPI001F26AA6D|nr:TrkA family potassium uptake protein [Fulvivirga ligni]UII19681.1 TrkA family potassium uptake protein [Fulvivirga ligni]
MNYIVIGLGNFGSTLSIALTEMGFEVIGIDKDMDRVNAFKDSIAHTIRMDSGDKSAMESLPLKECEAVIVCIGEDFGASVLATATLKELGASKIIGRAISDLHRTVIEAIGVQEIVSPESESATRLAKRLQLKDVIDSFELAPDYNILEIEVPEKYVGKTILESDFRSEYNLNVITIIRQVKKKNILGHESYKKQALGVVTPETQLDKHDILVIFGSNKDIKRAFKSVDA